MNNCLVTKLKSSVTDNNLLKLGELILTLKPKKERVTYSRVVMGSEDNYITILKGGYFCKTLKDTTPINGTIEESLTMTTSDRFALYFTEDEIQLKIKNKYTFKGIGYRYDDYVYLKGSSEQLNNIVYDISELYFCPNWLLFSNITKPIDLKNKIINALSAQFNVNLDGTSLQDDAVNGGVITLTNATGNIKNISKVSVSLIGDFSVNITNCIFKGNCTMKSPNVYGDIRNPTAEKWMATNVRLGSEDVYTRVTCSEPITKQLVQQNRILIVYSSEFTLNHIKNLINFPHVANVKIYTPLVTTEEVNADSDAMTKIANLKSAGGTISINGTVL